MALSATIYNFLIELSDVDRGVYETLDLRVAREPSEAAEYMLMRVLAYCLEYDEGIELTRGVAAGNEPAIYLRDRTGQITAWIEVGLPDAERLHRGSKLAGRSAVYTYRDVTQLLAQYAGKKIHRAEAIPIYAFERRVVEEMAAWLERRTKLAGRSAVYTYRDVTQLLAQYAGKKIHRAEAIPIYAFERRVVEEMAAWLERRTKLVIPVTERQLYLSVGERTGSMEIIEHKIG